MQEKYAVVPDIMNVDKENSWSSVMHTQTDFPIENQSDHELVAKIQSGEADHFIALYDKYIDKIYRFLLYRIQHAETAEDLTSQTFLKALDNIRAFDGSKGTFQAWLYKIAYNSLIDHYRKHKPTLDLSYAEHAPASDNTEQRVENFFNQQQVKALLQQLPEATQELIILRIWEELPYAEIAKILNKTENSLKMQFSRAISLLRDMEQKV